MPEITFVRSDGARRTVQVAPGTSVMRAAVLNDIGEIAAECGGVAACATCHVYVEDRPGLPPISSLEDEMLDTTAEPRRPNSRLSCQLPMTAELDGLVVGLPEAQT